MAGRKPDYLSPCMVARLYLEECMAMASRMEAAVHMLLLDHKPSANHRVELPNILAKSLVVVGSTGSVLQDDAH